ADTLARVAAQLAANSEKRPTGTVTVEHTFLLEGILRCGNCGSAMVRSVANGRSDTYYYYRCSRKLKTAGEACKLRDVPATAVEEFVLDELSEYVVDKEA